MVFHDGRRVLAVALATALLCASPSQAGILDSIKSLFGGGSKDVLGSAGGKEITALMDQVEASQKELASKQGELTSTYNGSLSNIKASDTALQGKLDGLQSASNGNGQLYLRLLQARADLAKAGDEKAMAPVTERIAKITSTQQALESNYQKIQDTNRQAGFFTPTGAAAASEIAAANTGNQAGDIWNDPTAQKYIDEWLSKCNLNGWGQWTGTTGKGRIKSAGAPDAAVGKSRYETVYKMLASDNGHSNITLAEYVESKLAGQNPNISYTPPSGGGIDPHASDTAPIRVEQVTAAAPPAPAAAPVAAVVAPPAASVIAKPAASTDSDIAVVDSQLKGNYDRLMSMQKEGKGTSDAAKALLKQIEGLQSKRTGLVKTLGR